MKKGLLAGIIVATGLALAACGSKETDSASSGGWEKIDDGTTEAATGSDFATAAEEDDLTPIEVQVGRLIVEVPGYYTASDSNTASSVSYEYQINDKTGSIILMMAEDATGIDETKFRNGKETMEENVRELLDFEETTLQNSQASEYMGMPGFSYDYKIEDNGGTGNVDVDVFLDSTEEKVYLLFFIETGELDRDVATDYGNMMRNAQWAEASAEVETSKGSDFATPTEEESSSASGSSSNGSGVTPEIKEALDSYESIMNSYCDFMEKYQSASATDLVSMMGDYTRMLGEYSDAMTALSKIDENSLNSTDLAYYMEVTNRVTQRLLKVAQ